MGCYPPKMGSFLRSKFENAIKSETLAVFASLPWR